MDEVGIEAPSIGIAYVGGGFADDAETYRGCVATQPVDRGEVLARCPASLAFALPPGVPPNPFPDFIPDRLWRDLPGVERSRASRSSDGDAPASRQQRELRMALVLLRERREGSRSPWHPYLSHLPRAYDLLGDWTDAQLDELHCERLRARALAQREENRAAHAACLGAGVDLTYEEVAWGLDTVRSRSFLGEWPRRKVEAAAGAKASSEASFEASSTSEASSEASSASSSASHSSSCSPPVASNNIVVSSPEPSMFVIPLLDAFNHASDGTPATRLRFVPPREEEHSGDPGETPTPPLAAFASAAAFAGLFELRSDAPLAVGDEACISYGKHANDELLLRFGFCPRDSPDETVPLPGCADELEWLMPGSSREGDVRRTPGLVDAIEGARVDREGRANANLLWALRACLASDEDYETVGGVHGLKVRVPVGLGPEGAAAAPGSGAQLAAEASVALACERALAEMGGVESLDEDEVTLAAAEGVLAEVEAECGDPAWNSFGDVEEDGGRGGGAGEGTAEDAAEGRCGTEGDPDDEPTYLRRLVAALAFRTGRKRILARAMARYSPLKEALVRSGDELYTSDFDEKVG